MSKDVWNVEVRFRKAFGESPDYYVLARDAAEAEVKALKLARVDYPPSSEVGGSYVIKCEFVGTVRA